MKASKKLWRLVWLLSAILVIAQVYLLITSSNTVNWSAKLLCTLLAIITLAEVRILQRETRIFRNLSWTLGGIIFALLIPQLLIPQSILVLWNFTLIGIALLSGLLMFAMMSNSVVGRAFVIFLTLSVSLLMILEFSTPLIHKIALGVFVSGALICIHVITTKESN